MMAYSVKIGFHRMIQGPFIVNMDPDPGSTGSLDPGSGCLHAFFYNVINVIAEDEINHLSMDVESWIRWILGSRIQNNYMCSCAVSPVLIETAIVYLLAGAGPRRTGWSNMCRRHCEQLHSPSSADPPASRTGDCSQPVVHAVRTPFCVDVTSSVVISFGRSRGGFFTTISPVQLRTAHGLRQHKRHRPFAFDTSVRTS
jgi:hypothetical protein